jgi:hypothetical protein
VLANSVPTTATVSRRNATLQLAYDGAPKFQPIEGTQMSYAINAQLPVILASGTYYALDNGVWFTATSATGPWQVATEVPEEIYTIPPNSPVYYATFASVYQSNDDEVEVGYTPGYLGAYEEDGTVVYGTGWDYQPWYGDDYYGWGWTWGYNYVYVPWYQWWIWRDWWNPPGGLRSALIENIYNRWSGGVAVTPHDGTGSTPTGIYKSSTENAFKTSADSAFKTSADSAFKTSADNAFKSTASYKGHPALYGRFQGSTRPVALSPPPNTIALNPYSRPTSAVRPGEIPRGAQLLTTLRQSPGGGRDLYASTDGHVYLRKSDGWYRRGERGGWNFVAPAQGTMERGQLASARGSGVGGNRPAARPNVSAGRSQGFGARVPNAGFEARAQDIAALEREYYARSLAQYRAANWRAGNYRARPARAGRRR